MSDHNWAQNKHMLVTGASSGIGKEICKRLMGTCRKITMIARDRDHSLQYTRDELYAELNSRRKQGEKNLLETKIESHSFDIRNFAKMQETVRNIYERDKDQIDLFINSAGGSHLYTTFENMNYQDIENIFDVNARAPIFWLRELLPYMKKNELAGIDKKRAHIIFLSSRSGERTLPKLSVYTMAKGTIEKMSEALQKEYAAHRIVFTLVNPGSINTDFTMHWSSDIQNAHNEESLTVEESVGPILSAISSQFATNKISYESVEQWFNEPGVIRNQG
ncbi:MAG: SDR family oxidoreductase [Oligoflexia bacterium]|nr:SDR family oxidoreductase [Oligoflexia bacterium]